MNNQLAELWELEYLQGGIPSSIRQKPSGAVERLVNFCGKAKVAQLKAVDIGCGTGRNTIYLSELGCDVIGVDFVTSMVARLQKLNLQAKTLDLTKNWSLPAEDYSLFIDTYCYFHIISLKDRLNYKQQLIQHASNKAFFLLSLASVEDGYYKRYIVREEHGLKISLDPGNHIECILYTPEQIINFFSPEFELLDFKENIQTNLMHGVTYNRKGYEFIFCLGW